MKYISGLLLLFSLTFLGSSASASLEGELDRAKSTVFSLIEINDQDLSETCLDEYGLRNNYLRKFLIYAPPTVILSFPAASYAYFLGMNALLSIAPYEVLFLAGFGIYYVAAPILLGTAITIEVKFTIEYFRNKAMVSLIDALRIGKHGAKPVKKFLKKFRKKYPDSPLSNKDIFMNVLNLDKIQSLCNGELTGSNSDRISKLLAKRKHLFEYLGKL